MAEYKIQSVNLFKVEHRGRDFNLHTREQFFIQGFFKLWTIKGVQEKNLRTLIEAKRVAKDIKNIERTYERIWREEDDSIPQFIPLRPHVQGGGHGLHIARPHNK